MAKEATCIGLMSGTSIDAVDAVIVAFGDRRPRILASYSKPVPDSLRKDVLTLCLPGEDHIDLMGSVDRRLGQLFAITANEAKALPCSTHALRQYRRSSWRGWRQSHA